MTIRKQLIIFFTFVSFVCVQSSPFVYERPDRSQIRYMQNFGYLPSSQNGAEFSFTPFSITEAIEKLQKFAGLKETGVLDKETKKLFSKRRCGREDYENASSRHRRFIIQQGWKKRIISYRLMNSTNEIPSSLDAPRILKRAFGVWAPHGNLKFIQKDDEPTDIKVAFLKRDHGDQYPFDGAGWVLGHAFAPNNGAIHLDGDEPWGEVTIQDETEMVDLFSVTVHEIGHALGLSHSPVSGSLMSPYYRLVTDNLSYDDQMAMYELYIKQNLPETDNAPLLVQPQTTEYTTTTAEVKSTEDQPPQNICDYKYDCIALIHGQLFVFTNKFLWIAKAGSTRVWQLGKVQNYFIGLPDNVKHIDAAYEREDNTVVLFSGREFWTFDTDLNVRHYSLDYYGIPIGYSNVDAVFLSNVNNKTYLFKDNQYWRFDERKGALDYGFPKPLKKWRGYTEDSVSSVVIKNGDTYLFHEKKFWRFDSLRVKIHENYPQPTSPIWFGCDAV